ncbi:MAG: excinuclease ABC subunit UvrA, partial [Clostridia bacterium]|nr:excinuclease ABC subunit UvrA [Clostridia bacterium]
MPEQNIVIKGAREHNLKNIDLTIPRDKFIVFTGLSGSGKSSLAFDTLYAEGQRRYVESLSSYARQFLGQMEKPDVDYIDGLSPAISIDQKTTSKNPRSTVGTITEIYDYMRLLYARIGIPHCPVCGREIRPQTVDQIVDRIFEKEAGTRFQLLSPVARGRKGEFQKELEQIRKAGFVRVRIDGILYDLSEQIRLDKNKKHNVEVVVDRLVLKDGIRARLTDSAETATKLSGGLLLVDFTDGEEQLFSLNYACPEHGVSFDELAPRMFSFNNPFGACKKCGGLGVFMELSPKLAIPDESLSLRQGAIKAFGWQSTGEGSIAGMYFAALGRQFGFTMDTPVKDMPEEGLQAILYGTGDKKLRMERPTSFGGGVYYTAFEGVMNNLRRRYNESQSELSRSEIEQFMITEPCPDCGGARLSKEALSVTVGGLNINELTCLSVEKELAFMEALPQKLTEREMQIGRIIIKEIRDRLSFLHAVGLSYLTLSRSAGSLSGGESQRIRLATQLGTSLMGVLYILDEPSIGLHQRDNQKLIDTLKHLRDLGNTLIVVEHDEDTMRQADHVVDIGPGAGIRGGEVVCQGTVEDIMACEESETGAYLSGRKFVPVPQTRRKGNGKTLRIVGAAENNLKNLTVEIPLGMFVCVTGVSGSGKSSLINEVLQKHLAARLNGARTFPGKCERIEGVEALDKVIDIDQSPIGRTPRSNPATYTGVFTDIRELFANTVDAKMKGYNAGRFSFNVKGGRCEACQGDGIVKIEMHFLADIYVPCEVCKGKKYNSETLAVKYKGKSIYDVLEMTVVEGMNFFENVP